LNDNFISPDNVEYGLNSKSDELERYREFEELFAISSRLIEINKIDYSYNKTDMFSLVKTLGDKTNKTFKEYDLRLKVQKLIGELSDVNQIRKVKSLIETQVRYNKNECLKNKSQGIQSYVDSISKQDEKGKFINQWGLGELYIIAILLNVKFNILKKYGENLYKWLEINEEHGLQAQNNKVEISLLFNNMDIIEVKLKKDYFSFETDNEDALLFYSREIMSNYKFNALNGQNYRDNIFGNIVNICKFANKYQVDRIKLDSNINYNDINLNRFAILKLFKESSFKDETVDKNYKKLEIVKEWGCSTDKTIFVGKGFENMQKYFGLAYKFDNKLDSLDIKSQDFIIYNKNDTAGNLDDLNELFYKLKHIYHATNDDFINTDNYDIAIASKRFYINGKFYERINYAHVKEYIFDGLLPDLNKHKLFEDNFTRKLNFIKASLLEKKFKFEHIVFLTGLEKCYIEVYIQFFSANGSIPNLEDLFKSLSPEYRVFLEKYVIFEQNQNMKFKLVNFNSIFRGDIIYVSDEVYESKEILSENDYFIIDNRTCINSLKGYNNMASFNPSARKIFLNVYNLYNLLKTEKENYNQLTRQFCSYFYDISLSIFDSVFANFALKTNEKEHNFISQFTKSLLLSNLITNLNECYNLIYFTEYLKDKDFDQEYLKKIEEEKFKIDMSEKKRIISWVVEDNNNLNKVIRDIKHFNVDYVKDLYVTNKSKKISAKGNIKN
jgi:hypothetical protein